MYLISVYFDEKTNIQINNYIRAVAKSTSNTFMLDNNVPPHITIATFETRNENKAIEVFDEIVKNVQCGEINWVTHGIFGHSVIYIAPVLNEYLHNLSVIVNEGLKQQEELRLDSKYQPFNWLPHTTIGKTLTKEQQLIAFKTMQNNFGIFNSTVTSIGLAKTNPFENLSMLILEERK